MGRVLVRRWFIVILCGGAAAQFAVIADTRAHHGETASAWFWGVCAFCAACNTLGYLIQRRDA